MAVSDDSFDELVERVRNAMIVVTENICPYDLNRHPYNEYSVGINYAALKKAYNAALSLLQYVGDEK